MRGALAAGLVAWSAALVIAQQPQTPPRVATGVSRVPAPAASSNGFETLVKPFLAANCYPCHGNDEHKRDLNFEAMTSASALLEQRERWDDVVQKLRDREMPPADEPQPAEHQRQAVAAWLTSELVRLDKTIPPNPGRVTARRLNRAEYNNTIRDLLGVDTHPADDFPQDDSGYGFDNIGDVLSLSPALMEKYISAAEHVTRTALFGPPRMTPTLVRLRSDGRRPGEAKTFPASYDVTGLSLSNAFHAIHRIPVEGDYVIRVGLGGLRPAGSAPISVALWIDDRQISSLEFDPERSARFDEDRQDFGGQMVEFRARLTAGDHAIAATIPRIFEGLPARYGGPNPSPKPEPKRREFNPPPNATPERVAQLRKQYDETQATLNAIPLNGVRIGSVDVGGPYAQVTGPPEASAAKIFVCGHAAGQHVDACVPRILNSLAARAFRRPVATTEMNKYIALARQAQRDEHSLEEGLAVGIQALLVSPDFLFRIERNRTASAGADVQRISQHELATRLSYFLWASMPDAPLRRAADMGTLRDPAVLEAQVRRMLRDPKAASLAEQFGGQWLQFRALESMTRNRERYPDFDEYLRQSMRRETQTFVEHVIREDRSILDFIDARYSYLNERLARHYGIEGVAGPEFRRVDLTGTPRGGVLTHASVLAVSSYATRTSPVLRGKWVLDNLLNAPPPDPPADVPNLDERQIGTTASLRVQLEQHRKDAICAACHRRMDPLGFGLENFDAIGAWRTSDGAFPIDAKGVLPGGHEFNGPEELRAVLVKQPDAFARCMTSKLMTYALGRGLERYDTRTVNAIAARLPARDYRFSALVIEIVNSLPFQARKRGPS
jgi:hypothetical protein